MRKLPTLFFVVSGILLPVFSSLAQPAPAISETDVRLWAASCAACHGTNGKAEGAGLNLAGQPAKRLYDALIAYKTDKRAATIMHQHAKGYSDLELLKIAEYFSKVK